MATNSFIYICVKNCPFGKLEEQFFSAWILNVKCEPNGSTVVSEMRDQYLQLECFFYKSTLNLHLNIYPIPRKVITRNVFPHNNIKSKCITKYIISSPTDCTKNLNAFAIRYFF